MTIDTFDVEFGFDFVHVYNGPTTSDSLLGSFTGNTLPPAVTSTGGTMLVHFTSDPSLNKQGFSAKYASCVSGAASVGVTASPSASVCVGETITFNGSTIGGPLDQNLSLNGSLTQMTGTSISGSDSFGISTLKTVSTDSSKKSDIYSIIGFSAILKI